MIELNRNSDGDLPSLVSTALFERKIEIAGGSDEVHLYTALATSWRNTSEAATRLLAALRNLQEASPTSKDYDDAVVSQALRSFIYMANEGFDFYKQSVTKRLEEGRSRSENRLIREYEAQVKRYRDLVGKMCNLMKHDYRNIVTGRITSQITAETTFVYRINTVYDGVQDAERTVHAEGGFASIERTLHEVLHGLLRADYNAGVLVRALSDNASTTISLRGSASLGLAAVLESVNGTRVTLAASEPSRFDGLEVLRDKVFLARVRGRKVAEPTKRTMKLTVDEAATGFKVLL